MVYLTATLVCKYDFFGEPGHRVDLMLRSISGTISLSAVYVAYRMIPLSDASTIHFASPVFVIIFAYFLLKEPITKLQIITGTVTLTGVVIIAKPEFLFGAEAASVHELRFEGTLLAVLASMTAAFSMISLRKLKTTPVAVTVMWYSFTLVIFGSGYLTIASKWTMPSDMHTWISLVIIGVCGIFDQYLITLAFQYEKAGPISVVRTFNSKLHALTIHLENEMSHSILSSSCSFVHLGNSFIGRANPTHFGSGRLSHLLVCDCARAGQVEQGEPRNVRSNSPQVLLLLSRTWTKQEGQEEVVEKASQQKIEI